MDAAATTSTTTAKHELVPQLQFPPGFRFVPTEDELVDVYLRAKIEGHKLPLQVINDVNILDWQPGKLVEAYKGYGENRWFFFTKREPSSSNKDQEPSRKVRVDGVTATWKATGSVQLIRRRPRSKGGGGGGDKVVVGSKRVLIYNSTDITENGKWSMHEYILKGHSEIGKYALYSIQRKQHSETEDNAGNDNRDPEKKKSKKRKRTETETPCTELEGVQLPHPHPEMRTLLAEPPLKPTRKGKAQRKKKPSLQIGVEGEQQQQQQQKGPSAMEPVTPPKKDEIAQQQGQSPTMQQEQTSAPPADGAPPAPVVLSAVPLQAVPDGTPGTSAPTLEQDTPDYMSQLYAVLYSHHANAMPCNNQGQEQWPPSLTDSTAFLGAPDTKIVVDHAPFLPYQQEEDSYSLLHQNQHLSMGENHQSTSVYMEQWWQHADRLLMNNTTQLLNNSGGWEHGNDHDQQRQIHQQQLEEENNGVAFGAVQDPKPMNHLQGGHDHEVPPMDEQSSGSDDLQLPVDGLLFGELDAFVRGVLVRGDEAPQDLAEAGTQEEGGDDNPATLQAASGGTQEEQGADGTATLQSLEHDLAWLRALNEHVRDGPCFCMICAAGLRHYYFPGP